MNDGAGHRPFAVDLQPMMTNDPLKLIDEARQANGDNNLELAEALLSRAIELADQMPRETREYSRAQGIFALWRFYQDRFAEAEIYQRRYMEAEKRLGLGERELANLTLFLAEMQQKQRKLGEAKATIENAINLFPPDPSELSVAYADLASILAELGDSNGASIAGQKSAELRKEWDDIVAARKPET